MAIINTTDLASVQFTVISPDGGQRIEPQDEEDDNN